MQSRLVKGKEDAVGRTAKAGKDVGVAIDQPDLVLDRHRLRIGDRESTLAQHVFQLGFTDDLPLTARQPAAAEIQRLLRRPHIGGNARGHLLERAYHVSMSRIELFEQGLRNDCSSYSRRFIEREDPLRRDAKYRQEIEY